MGRLQHRALVLVSVLGCVLGVSAATSPAASAVDMEVRIDGKVLRVTGDATPNDIEVKRDQNIFIVFDKNKNWAAVGASCSGQGTHQARCATGLPALSLALDAGGGNDTIRIDSSFAVPPFNFPSPAPVADGGPGDDTLATDTSELIMQGGSGDD